MCTSPITIRQHGIGGEHSIQVPCGKCCECKRKYQNSWYVRLNEQLRESGKMVFFTLTYNEDTVPLNIDTYTGESHRSVRRSDVVNWIKRFRTRRERAGKSTDFKYFVTSEYGPRTLRPHYHGCLFGLDYYDCRSMFREWESMFGFTKAETISYGSTNADKSIRYVSKYCSKGVFENPKVDKGLVDPTFHLISKKIGFSFITRMRDYYLCKDLHIQKFLSTNVYNPVYVRQVLNRKFVQIGDFRYGMPRYYSNYIYSNLVKKSSLYGQRKVQSRRKDCLVPLKSQLQIEMSNLAFQDSFDLRESRAKELYSTNIFRTYAEAYGFACSEEMLVLSARASEARTALAKFFEYSHI